MAGNRRAYEAAMKRAASLAWEKKWSKAIEEYEKALAEFQDVAVLTGIGLAYVETRQLEKALQVYKQAANLAQENPEVLQRVGYVYERLAQLPDAARTYVLAGEAAARMRDVAQAIEIWHKAAVLSPENLDAHRNLVRAYREYGEGRDETTLRVAAWHYLIMARVLARRGKFDEATECAQEAGKLDPRNAEAAEVLEALQRGLPLPDGPTARLQPDEEGRRSLDSFVVFEDIEVKETTLLDEGARVSPADLILRRSLSRMAEALFSDDVDPSQMLLGQAADLQTRGLLDQALDAYTNAVRKGADDLSVYYNIGLLYREKQDFPRAIEHLNRAISRSDLVLGVNFAIGESYYRWGKLAEALPFLLESLRLLDLQMVPAGRRGELNAAYEQIRETYSGHNGSQATQLLARSIVDFLSSRGWNERIIQARKQMDRLAQDGILIVLAEMLTEPEANSVMESMAHVQEYVAGGKLFSALEECLAAIRQSPFYLPLHLCMADLLIAEERSKDAADKYAMVARTYQVRGDLNRAVQVYRKALAIAPMDIGMRERFIELLVAARQFDQAIEQHIIMADTYYQLVQIDQAIEQYNQALKYAPQSDPARHWEVNILHRIGDINIQRVDWRQAIRVYQRIKHIEPEDEKARALLVDLSFKTGQRDQAMSEVDNLIEFYQTGRQPQKLVAAMQMIIATRPQDVALHMRMAKVYLDLRRKKDAIAELDTVGELQMEEGKTQDAVRTVQAIIRLEPDNVEQYKQLLAQLIKK